MTGRSGSERCPTCKAPDPRQCNCYGASIGDFSDGRLHIHDHEPDDPCCPDPFHQIKPSPDDLHSADGLTNLGVAAVPASELAAALARVEALSTAIEEARVLLGEIADDPTPAEVQSIRRGLARSSETAHPGEGEDGRVRCPRCGSDDAAQMVCVCGRSIPLEPMEPGVEHVCDNTNETFYRCPDPFHDPKEEGVT